MLRGTEATVLSSWYIILIFDEVVSSALSFVADAVSVPVEEDVVSHSFDADGQRRRLRADRTANVRK